MDLGDVAHSNNWVIHGKHTASGKPLLSNDPHLGTSIPSVWQQTSLTMGDNTVIGAIMPGVPGVAIGTSKTTSWGITAPLSDSSDLWQEKLSDDLSQYFVDGEWRDLEVHDHLINVKGYDKPVDFKVRYTHRGPLF